MNTKEITLRYFNAWQEPADFNELSVYLADSFKIDAGVFEFDNKKEFIKFLKANHTPWKDVKLLASIFSAYNAAILYEGVNTVTGKKMRVSEHIRFADNKIVKINTVIAQIN